MATFTAVAGLVCASAIFLYFSRLDRMRAETVQAAPAETAKARPRRQGFAIALDRIGRRLARRPPAGDGTDPIQVQLTLAGNPANLSPAAFMAMRLGLAALLVLMVLSINLALGPAPISLAEAAAAGAIGYFLPLVVLNLMARGRRLAIQEDLPDAVDLLTLAVEAGLSLDAGMADVTSRFHNALGDEFAKALREIRLGRPRMAALEDMGRRSGVPELHNLIQAITQSEQMGVPISRSLRVQAGELRRGRRSLAQEKAARASLRMVFPMVGCIFPTIWIILLGPALLGVVRAWHG